MSAPSLHKIVWPNPRRIALPPEADVADEQLLARFIRHHDENAFEALVKRHGPMVLGVCRRVLNNAHDADDAFQATFLILVHKAASVQSLANWLYGVAYRTALQTKSATARRRCKEKQVMTMPEPARLPSEDWSELRPFLDQELSELGNVYREAIVLCDLEGKTRKQAARQLGVPESTLSGRLTTARRLLAKRLARRGVTLSVAGVAALLSQSVVSARVPGPLFDSTVKAATSVAAGSATAGLISSRVVAITEGVMKTMFMSKMKTMTAVVLAFLVVIGLTAFGYALALPGAPADAKQQQKNDPGKQPEKKQAIGTGEVGQQILDKALKAHGGEQALQKLKRIYVKSEFMGQKLGTKFDDGFGKMESYLDDSEKFKDVFGDVLERVFDGEGAWQVAGGTVFDESDDPESIAWSRGEAYVQMVTRLYGLKDKSRGFRFSPLPEAKDGNTALVGVRVTCKDRPDVDLFFDKSSFLLVKAEYKVQIDFGNGLDDIAERRFSDFKELIPGLKVPSKIMVKEGVVSYEIRVSEMRSVERHDAGVFAKP